MDFLSKLYDEKLKHKEHRHEFVKQKLLFIIGLSSIGSLNNTGHFDFSILLYFIPFVAIAYDVYICSEDFKIKRIGVYVRRTEAFKGTDDANWETWLNEGGENREQMASIASFVLTLITLFSTSYLLHHRDKTDTFVYGWWLGISIAMIVIVYVVAIDKRRRLFVDSKNK